MRWLLLDGGDLHLIEVFSLAADRQHCRTRADDLRASVELGAAVVAGLADLKDFGVVGVNADNTRRDDIQGVADLRFDRRWPLDLDWGQHLCTLRSSGRPASVARTAVITGTASQTEGGGGNDHSEGTNPAHVGIMRPTLRGPTRDPPIHPYDVGVSSRVLATSPRLLGWLGPILMMVVGGLLRIRNLGRPDALVFDETYYAKDALSLLLFGYERQAVEGADQLILDSDGRIDDLAVFQDTASFVVHPPAGKWLIALGEAGFGMTPIGWRITVAVLGTLAILVLGRVLMRMTGNALVATIGALLLALDGIAIVMSRITVLDGILMFAVLMAFHALLADRDWARRRYLELVSATGDSPVRLPVLFWRPWRLAAGAWLGIALSVKWSGLWFIAAFGLLSVLWELGARRRAGVRRAVLNTALLDAVPAFLSLVVFALLVYLLTWFGWFLSDDAWARDAVTGGNAITDALASLWSYHGEIYRFHVGLASEHPYQSSAWSWLVQARPTSFFFESLENDPTCLAEKCSQTVNAVGNPALWWLGTIAVLHQTYRAVFVRDWRGAAVVVGLLAGWAPWLLYADRTIFSFYSVVFVPFVAAALALSLGQVLGTSQARPGRRAFGAVVVGAVLLLVVAAAWWFLPIWTAETITTEQWQQRMWFQSWI